MKKFSFYTGPSIVHQVANQLRANGMIVYLEGTAHVYFMTDVLRASLLPSWVKLHEVRAYTN